MSMAKANKLLWDSAIAGDLDGAQTALKRGADTESVSTTLDYPYYKRTALILAAEKGKDRVVRFLINHGANMEAREQNGYTALIWASRVGHERTAEILVSKQANMNAKSYDGRTALMFAADSGYTQTVICLGYNGANLNTQDNDAMTALMSAALWGYKETVEVLVHLGANKNIKNNDGKTALDLAIQQKYPGHDRDYPAIIKILKQSSDGSQPISEVDRIKEDNSRLQAQNNQLTTINSRLQVDLQSERITSGRLQADLQRERDTAGRLQADLQRLQADFERECDMAGSLQTDLQTLEACFERECDTASKLQADLQSKCDTVSKVQRELQKKDNLLRLQHDQNQQKLEQLDADNRRLVHQIQDLQSRLTESTAEINVFRFTRIQIPNQDQDSWNVPRHEVDIQMNLGEGAWGSVHKGVFRGQQVAVKLIHKEILQEYTIDQMKREIRVMSHIQHPNLAQLIAAVVDDEVERCTNSPLLILELLHSNLRTAYGERELTRNVLISIFRDVAYALHYLHEHQEPIIHRDVSAPNVLLEELSFGGWRAKLSDFGSANIARDCKTAAPGAIVYSAPETYPPENPYDSLPKQTTKIDVFSYGYVIAEVIAKEMPAPEKRRRMLISIETQWKTMHELIMECIKSKPEDRSTMTQVLQRLNSLPFQ